MPRKQSEPPAAIDPVIEAAIHALVTRLASLRVKLAQARQDNRVAVKELEATPQSAQVTLTRRLVDELEAEEKEARALITVKAREAFRATKTKHPHEVVELRTGRKLTVTDVEQATRWAKANAPVLLSLDVQAALRYFETAYRDSLPPVDVLAFLGIEETFSIAVPTDLTLYVPAEEEVAREETSQTTG